ncbi:MAG: hypothetical protein M3O71_32315 [Bacteroidota bacterium]|nr:hypothetical protein [Bacteroidota bacterium]
MAYAYAQNNGSLHQRMQMDTMELEILFHSNSVMNEQIVYHQTTNI